MKKSVNPDITCGYETTLLKKLSALVECIYEKAEGLDQALLEIGKEENVIEKGYLIRDEILTKMSELRLVCDEAETLTAKSYWPYPTYGDILFSVR